MTPIRVMVVEDSPTVRALLCEIIARDRRLQVCASAESGEQALRLLEGASPDVISLDIRLPGMNGLAVAERVMSRQPTPIVVVAASDSSGEQALSVEALAAGALSVVEKPRGASAGAYYALAEKICTQLAIMSQVKVVRRRFHGAAHALRGMSLLPSPGRFEVLGIVCSTGGPPALVKIFSGLEEPFPLPILLVQHITPAFLPGFASWLASACPFAVEIVSGQSVLRPGVVYLAAPEFHLRASRTAAHAVRGEPVAGHRPSGSVLFKSLAEEFGPRALGALLTGMGEDGADGLLALKNAGGYTLAESESTAVVYGMPAAAVRLKAVRESLPLDGIAARLKQIIASNEVAV